MLDRLLLFLCVASPIVGLAFLVRVIFIILEN